MEVPTFSWLDYSLFVLMLVASALVGVYFGFIKKQNTANDYLLGGKQMDVLPVSFSIISSGISGFTMLSVPADIYKYGIGYALNVPALIVLGLTTYYVFLPVFYKLQVTSTYEYFNVRFNYKVRVFASILFAINATLFLPIVIYIPALALGQVTNMNIYLITSIVCGVCIFYTTLGGLKAVVWTDAIQFVVMITSTIIVTVIGIQRGGGISEILGNAYTGRRLEVSFDFDFLKRDTFWACFIGQSIHMHSTFPVNQGPVQKFLSLPSFSSIKITIILAIIGFAAITSLSVFSGLIMFSKYMDCDPLEANIIKSYDQILPLFVMEEISHIPGLSGLFISGIFSAGLSTLSAILNCLAATVYEDFVSPFVPKDTSQQRISQYLKLIVACFGILSASLVYVVEKLGSLVALTLSFAGVTSGPMLGLFCVGMLLPAVNAKGALTGGIVSLLVMSWIVMTSQWYNINGMIRYPTLPISTLGCNETTINEIKKTLTNIIPIVSSNTTNTTEQPIALYRVSFYWYASMGFITCVITALVVSYFSKEDKPINKDSISPVVHFLLRERKRGKLNKYDDMSLEKLNK